MGRQKQLLGDSVDVVVSTLDRLEKHLNRKQVFLSQVRYFIVDEADTFVDAGFKSFLEKYIAIFKQKY